MRKPNDLTGQVFGGLTALSLAEPDSVGKTKWWCQCTCGKTKSIRAGNLIAGSTTSCGCIKRGPKPKPVARPETRRELIVQLWEGIPRRGHRLGFCVFGSITIPAMPRPSTKSVISVTKVRMLNELCRLGIIPARNERSHPIWIQDSGVVFRTVMTGDPDTIREAYAEVQRGVSACPCCTTAC